MSRVDSGFSLLELLLAMALAATITTGMVQLSQGATRAFATQQGLAALQENARFAATAIMQEVRQAGFAPAPWTRPASSNAASASQDGGGDNNDRLVLQRASRLNCHGLPNPSLAVDGQPAPALLETGFFIDANGNLAKACRYGPDAGSLVTQINNLGLVESVEALQVQYALDIDADGGADLWVGAGQWQAQDRLLGARIALLLASPDPLAAGGSGASPAPLALLDASVSPPADGRLRQVAEFTVALHGALR